MGIVIVNRNSSYNHRDIRRGRYIREMNSLEVTKTEVALRIGKRTEARILCCCIRELELYLGIGIHRELPPELYNCKECDYICYFRKNSQ